MPEPSRHVRLSLSVLVVALSVPAATSAQVVTPASGAGTRNFQGALVDSFRLASIEHAIRIAFQEKTRRELTGPFWEDYRRSVRLPQQWADTDSWAVNYIGHPIHGAAAGMIWIDHSEMDRNAPLFSGHYLASRGRAAAFSAIYSLQFEIGPLSEASIGNVGMNPATTGWVDHVVTPVGAFGFMVAEDALDRYVVRWVESHTRNRAARVTVRMLFGPARVLANTAQNRLPWYRRDRPLSW